MMMRLMVLLMCAAPSVFGDKQFIRGSAQEIGREAGRSLQALEPESVEYMACLKDQKSDRVFEDKLATSADMTGPVCRTHCEGYMYYATQFGIECWCGDSEEFATYDRHGDGICDIPCSGDTSVACGGTDAFSLYRMVEDVVEATTAPTTYPFSPCKAGRK